MHVITYSYLHLNTEFVAKFTMISASLPPAHVQGMTNPYHTLETMQYFLSALANEQWKHESPRLPEKLQDDIVKLDRCLWG